MPELDQELELDLAVEPCFVIERPVRSAARRLLVATAVGSVALVMILATAWAIRTDGDGARGGLRTMEPPPDPARPDLPPGVELLEVLERRHAVGYRAGRRQPIEVVALGTAEVEVNTAAAFLAMRRAAAEDGVELTLESGYRTREQQAELYRAWRRGKGPIAARPGRSNHQSGRALDIAVNSAPGALEWLEANAARFDFKRTVRSEPWHWEYVKTPRARGKARVSKKARARALRAKRKAAAAKRKAAAAKRGGKAKRAGGKAKRAAKRRGKKSAKRVATK